MRMRHAFAIAVAMAAPLAAQQPPPPAPAKTISEVDRTMSLTMLANVKADLKDYYYDPGFRGIDLDATFADASQRVKAASSVNETIAIIADVLLRLNDSHTIFLPPNRKARVVYGWRATMVGDEPYVTSVTAG